MPKIKIKKVVIKWSEGWMDTNAREYATVEDAEVELREISRNKEKRKVRKEIRKHKRKLRKIARRNKRKKK